MPPSTPTLDAAPGDLATLRADIDRIDDALHGLLMRRAEIVAQVGASVAKAGSPIALRPGREAAIIRRLLARHEGHLPREALVRLWRELLAGTTAMQRPLIVAVCETGEGAEVTQAAREQFGALTPLRIHRNPARAIADVSAGTASAAVLPLPTEDEPRQAVWWTALLHDTQPRIHVVARLPFWAPRPSGAPTAEALVATTIAPDPSGQDRSIIGLELDRDMTRARLTATLTAVDLAPGALMILRRDPGMPVAQALAEVDGMIAEADPRLARLEALRRPVLLGAYARPVNGADA